MMSSEEKSEEKTEEKSEEKTEQKGAAVYVCLHRMKEEKSGGRKEKTEDLVRQLAGRMPEIFGGRSDIRIIRSAAGAPLAAGMPDLHLSVSHSGGWWVCAVSDLPLGIDLEYPRPYRNESPDEMSGRLIRIAGRFFTPEEKTYIEGAAEASGGTAAEDAGGVPSARCEGIPDRFLRIWTAREAYVKYLGTGVDAGFEQLSVLPDGGGSGLFRTEDAWTARGVRFRMITLPEGAGEAFRCCLCTEREGNVIVRTF